MSSAADTSREAPNVNEPVSFRQAATRVTLRWFYIIVGASSAIFLPSYFWVSHLDFYRADASRGIRILGGATMVTVTYAFCFLLGWIIRDKWLAAVRREMS